MTSHLFSEESLGSNPPLKKKKKIRFKSRIQHALILVEIYKSVCSFALLYLYIC